jgi:hypothetical protein
MLTSESKVITHEDSGATCQTTPKSRSASPNVYVIPEGTTAVTIMPGFSQGLVIERVVDYS